MFKKVEVLDKAKHKDIKFDDVSPNEVAKHINLIPLGFDEVLDMSFFCPVIISGKGDNLEFMAFCGINPLVTIFNKEGQYLPFYTQTYPFLNGVVIDEKNGRQEIIAIDKSDFVDKKKTNIIFKKSGELDILASKKIELIRTLNKKRDISKKIIKELKNHELLKEQDFQIGYQDETKTILDKFFVVDRVKLQQLDDETLALWSKKGWITLIDMHLKSLGNFKKVIFSEK